MQTISNELLEKCIMPIVAWYEQNARPLPWRADKDPYHIWVSEIMLQQTRIEAVIPYYARFMAKLPTIEALAACDDEELHKLWEGLGYYSRVRNLKKAALTIMEEDGGEFPRDFDKIRALSGIGDYTAGAISSMAFGNKKAAVDGNVLRVLTRIAACDRDIMEQAFRKEIAGQLEALYPDGHEASLTQGLMELGELICLPNGTPDCEHCPVREFCCSHAEGRETEFPVKKPKAERKVVEMTVFRLIAGGKTALHKRPEEGLLASLWEYPNVVGKVEMQGETNGNFPFRILDDAATTVTDDGFKTHIFTHIEWHMHCYTIHLASTDQVSDGDLVWTTDEERKKGYTLPTAFKKLWK